MSLRPRSLATDLFSVGSSVVQYRLIREQTRRLEAQLQAQSEYLWQQKAISEFLEINRRNLIEKRKLLLRFDDFTNRALEVHGEYPEYATMMMEFANKSLSKNNLSADDFEDLQDMEKSKQINHKVSEAATNMRQNLTIEQSITVDRMKIFLRTEEDMMEEHAVLCKENENWDSMSEHFAEIDSLRKVRKKEFHIVSAITSMIAIFGLVLWRMDSSIYASFEFLLSLIVFGWMLAIIWMRIWSREYEKDWKPMKGQQLLVELSKDRFNFLGNKFSTFSSNRIIKNRLKMKQWLDLITPRDDEKKLYF